MDKLRNWSCFPARQKTRTRLSMGEEVEKMSMLTQNWSTEGSVDIYFSIGDLRYVALGHIPFELTEDPKRDTGSLLVTIVEADESMPLSQEWLDNYLDRLFSNDFQPKQSFLTGLIITRAKATHTVPSSCRRYLKSLGNRWVQMEEQSNLSHLPPGPYLYTEKTLKPVYRLYDDTCRTFLTAVKPKLHSYSSTPYEQLKAGGTFYDCLSVAVPPRPASTRDSRPLSQLRMAVKDCFFLQGLKSSLCNQAYYDFSDPAPFTAEAVQILVKQGAIVLGRNKLSSMIGREEPLEAVDFHIPFNPRGDGYQSPAGSSNGSAACVAAYDWIDCAIGTDSSGSGRRPAMVNGVWQFRPSHRWMSLSGMIQTYSRFDTSVVFARSLSVIKPVAEAWLAKSFNETPSTKQYHIIYPLDYLPVENTEQMQLIDRFVEDMRVALPAKVTKFSIREAWKLSHPPGTPESVDNYLANTLAGTYYYAHYHLFAAFRKGYAEKHDGKPPYVPPFLQDRWGQGAAASEEQHKDAEHRIDTYKQWLLDTMFTASSSEAETLVVLPIANAAPNYRDEISQSPRQQSALDQLFLPSILGAPDIAIPIGEVPYASKITNRTEYLPVVIDIMGAPMEDRGLFQAVEKIMEFSGRPTTVTTGSRIFQHS